MKHYFLACSYALFMFSAYSGNAQILGPDTAYVGMPTTFHSGTIGSAYTWITDSVQLNLSPVLTGDTVYSGTPLNGIDYMTTINDNGNWYGLISNYANNTVSRLDFGNSLDNTPTSSGSFSGIGNGYRTEGVDVVEQNGDYYGFVVNGAIISRLDFGNSMANTPSVSQVVTSFPLPSNGQGYGLQLEIKKVGGQYIGFIADKNGYLWRIEFGTDITNTPTLHYVSTTGGGYYDVGNFALYQEKGDWYMLLTNTTNVPGVSRLSFGTDLTNNSPALTFLGNPNNIFDITRSIIILADCDELYALVENESGKLYKMDFNGDIINSPAITYAGQMTPMFSNNCLNVYTSNHKLKMFAPNWGTDLIKRIDIADLPSSSVTYYSTDSFVNTFAAPGTYSMTLYVNQGNAMGPVSGCKTVTVLGKPNGISGQSVEAKVVEVFPNPTSNTLSFTRNINKGNWVISLYGILGKRLFSRKIVDGQNNISFNLGSIANGIYHYNIIDEDGTLIKSGQIRKQ